MIRPGLCSVTFRELDPARIVELAAVGDLACVEWAGDVHVPPGDTAAAKNARSLTEGAGLVVASYGSYLRFDGTDAEFAAQARDVLVSAAALGAPRIRVWAGRTGSAETAPTERARIVDRIRDFADAADSRGLDVGLEFHGGTLTDEVTSTLNLLDEIDHPRVLSYWQPHQGMPDEEALETLRLVLPHTSTIHVFSWWPRHERLPLADRAPLWRKAFGILAAEGSDRDALLEFVPEDEPGLLAREAGTLRELITAGEEEAR